LVERANIHKYAKPISKRQPRVLNKHLYRTPRFEEFWETISRKTHLSRPGQPRADDRNAVRAIREAPQIDALRVQ
jgi:type III restriction enzyme